MMTDKLDSCSTNNSFHTNKFQKRKGSLRGYNTSLVAKYAPTVVNSGGRRRIASPPIISVNLETKNIRQQTEGEGLFKERKSVQNEDKPDKD